MTLNVGADESFFDLGGTSLLVILDCSPRELAAPRAWRGERLRKTPTKQKLRGLVHTDITDMPLSAPVSPVKPFSKALG